MDITACPQPGCGLPAEVKERVALSSTDGQIEHARVLCLGGHGFFMPTMMLSDEMPTSPLPASETRPAADSHARGARGVL